MVMQQSDTLSSTGPIPVAPTISKRRVSKKTWKQIPNLQIVSAILTAPAKHLQTGVSPNWIWHKVSNLEKCGSDSHYAHQADIS